MIVFARIRRSAESMRKVACKASDHWAERAMEKEDQAYAQELSAISRCNSALPKAFLFV